MGFIEQKRDIEIVKFIISNPCYSSTIADVFFSGSPKICNRRLLKLIEQGYLNRTREYVCQQYFYYGKGRKKPKQLNHLDLIARTHLLVTRLGYEVIEWEREPTNLKGIRPDVKCVCKKDGVTKTIYIEVERFHNCLNQKISKYEANWNDSNPFSVLYCCNDRCTIKKRIDMLKIIQISLDVL